MSIIAIIWKIFPAKNHDLDKYTSEAWQELHDVRFYYDELATTSAVAYSVKCTYQLNSH